MRGTQNNYNTPLVESSEMRNRTNNYTKERKEIVPTSTTFTTARRDSKKPELRCYNCQKFGRISRDCVEPRRPMKCLTCGAEGHTVKYCTKSKIVVNVAEQMAQNKYVKNIKINNSSVPVHGLIDTGCDVCLIKQGSATRYELDIVPTERRLTVYGNQEVDVVCGTAIATVTIDAVTKVVQLWVVKDEAQRYDVLIGRTFTEADNVSFVKTEAGITFGYDYEHPFSDCVSWFTNGKTSVRSKYDCVLPATSVNIVESTADTQEVNVLLTNLTNAEVKLVKGEYLGIMYKQKTITEEMVATQEPIALEMIRCGDCIGDNEKLMTLLNEFRMCFALNMRELGYTSMIEMDIIDNEEPVVCRPYRTSAAERETIDKIVAEWKEAGIVTETSSTYTSPVLLVMKKDGEPRLVVDYRKLNSQTVRRVFPTPNIDEHLETLTGAKMFCTLDLASGYLQVPLTERAKAKTAFITPSET